MYFLLLKVEKIISPCPHQQSYRASAYGASIGMAKEGVS